METRKYKFKLVNGAEGYLIDGASVSFDLSEGYPYITASAVHIDQVAALLDGQRDGTLISKSFSFNIELTGIKNIVNIDNLVVGRINPSEHNDGYGASISLLPRAAAYSTAYPGVFFRNKYDYTVRTLIQELMSDFNSKYPSHVFSGLMFESDKEPISLVVPRFIQMPYFEMIRSVARYHGLNAIIDFDSRVRIFSALTSTSTASILGKHNVIDSTLTLDILQSISG